MSDLRIESLKIQNVNSLRGAWEIDFSAVPGLFLISGPTGAGKSSIFDAACLAIFGATPRCGRIGAENPAMTTGEFSCAAEAVFTAEGRRYRAVFEQVRTKKSGRLQPAKRTLYRDAECIASGAEAVREAVVRAVGMDFQRFLRCVMLAQGGFAGFLLAKPKERALILEHITDTAIYGELSMAAYRRYDAMKKEATALEENTVASIDTALFKRRLEGMTKSLKRLDEFLSLETKRAEAVKKWEESAKDFLSVWKDFRLLRRDYEKYAASRKMEPLRLLLAEWDRLKQSLPRLSEWRKEIAELRNAYVEAKKDRDQKKADCESAAVTQAEKKKIADEDRMLAGRPEFLYAQKAAANYAAAAESFATAKKNGIDAMREWRVLKKECAALPELDVAALRAKKAASEKFHAALELWKARRKAWREAEKVPPKSVSDADIAELAAAEDAVERLAVLRPEFACAVAEARNGASSHAAALAKLAAAEADNRALRLWEALAELRGNIPAHGSCPLCGNVVEQLPDMPEKPAGASSEQLATLRRAAQDASERRGAAFGKLRAVNDVVYKLKKKAKKWPGKEEAERLRQAYAASKILASGRDVRESALSAAGEWLALRHAGSLSLLPKALRREELQTRHAAAREKAAAGLLSCREKWRMLRDVRRELQQAEKDAEAIRARRNALALQAGGDPQGMEGVAIKTAEAAVQALEAAEKRFAAVREQGVAVRSRLDADMTRRKEICAALLDVRRKIGSVSALRNALINVPSLSEAAEFEGRFAAAESALAKARAARRDALAALQNAPGRGEIFAQRLRRTREKLSLSAGAVRERLRQAETVAVEVKEKGERLAALRKEMEIPSEMSRLIGSADGGRFRVFAQGVTLDRVLSEANVALSKMMPRYRLARLDEGDLAVAVDDDLFPEGMREASGLSGGETFVASLALALGLSRMSGNMGSLFLDEGFGSLDTESLSMVVEALGRLAVGGLSCGVISHVPALAGAIPEGVRVVPVGNGTSVLEGPGCRKL